MNDALRARREHTWELLVLEGRDREEVVDRIATDYDVTEATIRQDIARMDEWLPALAERPATNESRLLELRQTRQRLYQMAREAHEADDLRLELDIHREIIRTLTLDDDLEQHFTEDDAKKSFLEKLADVHEEQDDA